jgi:hypothetical protein
MFLRKAGSYKNHDVTSILKHKTVLIIYFSLPSAVAGRSNANVTIMQHSLGHAHNAPCIRLDFNTK